MAVNKTNKRPSSANPLDQPVTEETINYYVGQLAKVRPDIAPDLLRKYTIFYLSGKDLGDLSNENLGFINNVLNPNSFTTPNLAITKDTNDYFYGVVGGPTYKKIYEQAFEVGAPTWVATEKELKNLKKDSFSFKRAVLLAIKNGATPQSIAQTIRETNAAVASSKDYRESLKKAGLSTPFDNLTTEDALKFTNTMYNEYYDARNTFTRTQEQYLKSDPYFSKGLPDPKFTYGLETNYQQGTIKHPLADFIKPRAEETSVAIVKSNFPNIAPEMYAPTDRPERLGAAKTTYDSSFGSLKGKKVTAKQLKDEAFKVAANQFLNITQKDASGNTITDKVTNQPIRITPLEDALSGRLAVGTNVRG